MEKLLSVVIPVYKVEKFIDKCISSLIVPDEKQLQLLDVVIINDGTPDNSAVIAKGYEKKYPGIIRVIDQENRGHGGALNHGTELAVGKYLFYLDSDDWFDTEELSRLITYLGKVDVDMVLINFQIYRVAEDKCIPVNRRKELQPEKVYDSDQFEWLETGHAWNMTYLADTIFRTAMMQKYLPLFCEHVIHDDGSLQTIPIAIAKDFVYTPLDVYRYYIGRPGQSIDPQRDAEHAADCVTKVHKFILDWVKRNRDAVPKGGTREIYTEASYQSLGTWHYVELAQFPLHMARPRLKEWDAYLRANYPDIRPIALVRWYRILPTYLFRLGVKFQLYYVSRAVQFIKRKLGIH
jgi:glycosyltransferase involved in cell wall biosynthesis